MAASLTTRSTSDLKLYVQIVPRLLTLSLGQSSKLFRDASILSVIKQILKDGGIPDDALDFRSEAVRADRAAFAHAVARPKLQALPRREHLVGHQADLEGWRHP